MFPYKSKSRKIPFSWYEIDTSYSLMNFSEHNVEFHLWNEIAHNFIEAMFFSSISCVTFLIFSVAMEKTNMNKRVIENAVDLMELMNHYHRNSNYHCCDYYSQLNYCCYWIGGLFQHNQQMVDVLVVMTLKILLLQMIKMHRFLLDDDVPQALLVL